MVKRWIAAGAPAQAATCCGEGGSHVSSLADKPVASLADLETRGSLDWTIPSRFDALSGGVDVRRSAGGRLCMVESARYMDADDRFLVILGALGAVAAASLGWINASFTNYVGSSATILKYHRWLGTFTAGWTVICAGLAIVNECRKVRLIDSGSAALCSWVVCLSASAASSAVR
jgi:hypothetical protein